MFCLRSKLRYISQVISHKCITNFSFLVSVSLKSPNISYLQRIPQFRGLSTELAQEYDFISPEQLEEELTLMNRKEKLSQDDIAFGVNQILQCTSTAGDSIIKSRGCVNFIAQLLHTVKTGIEISPEISIYLLVFNDYYIHEDYLINIILDAILPNLEGFDLYAMGIILSSIINLKDFELKSSIASRVQNYILNWDILEKEEYYNLPRIMPLVNGLSLHMKYMQMEEDLWKKMEEMLKLSVMREKEQTLDMQGIILLASFLGEVGIQGNEIWEYIFNQIVDKMNRRHLHLHDLCKIVQVFGESGLLAQIADHFVEYFEYKGYTARDLKDIELYLGVCLFCNICKVNPDIPNRPFLKEMVEYLRHNVQYMEFAHLIKAASTLLVMKNFGDEQLAQVILEKARIAREEEQERTMPLSEEDKQALKEGKDIIYFYTKKDKRGKYSRMVEGSNLDYNNYTQYPISIRPSLLSGNLSFTGEDMLYISNAEPGARCAIVCIKDMEGDPNGSILPGSTVKYKELLDITHVRAYFILEQWHIVLGLYGALQIYNYNGTRLLTHVTPKQIPENEYPFVFLSSTFTKCAEEGEVICAGNSLGEIYAIKPTKAVYLKEQVHTIPNTQITCLATENSSNLMIVGDSGGSLTLLRAINYKEFEYKSTIVHEKSLPVLSLEVLSRGATTNFLLSGSSDGCVRVYGLPQGLHLVNINAHSRSVTDIAVHPTLSCFATVGEDECMHLFEVVQAEEGVAESGVGIKCLKSSKLENVLLTGIKFAPPHFGNLVGLAYDCQYMFLWKNIV